MSMLSGHMVSNWRELCGAVEDIGFLPLLDCGVPGFSVQALTPPELWQTRGENNPWEWRYHIADSRRVMYGKFFGGKVGFASKKCFPTLANYRRRGYDFDAAADEGLVSSRLSSVMELFSGGAELSSFEIKSRLAFGGGERLDKTLNELMMRTYLVISGFERKTNRYGAEYGWPVAKYSAPETLLGAGFMAEAYSERPEVSKAKLLARLKAALPNVPENRLSRFLG